ncbi:MAG: ABC transporter ATP-binding protein [Nannocystaceae bacterium]
MNDDGTPRERPADPLTELLGALARAAGRSPTAEALADALAEATRLHPGALGATWLPRLTEAGARVGLRIAGFEASPAELCARGRPQGTIAACLDEDEASTWLVIDGWRESRARIDGDAAPEPGAWIDADALAGLCGLADAEAPRLWALAEAIEAEAPPAGPEAHPRRPTPVGRLTALMRLEARDLWAIVVYAVGVGVFALATPVAVQALVNTVAFGALLQPLVVLALLLLAGLALAGGLRAIQVWVVELLQRRLFVRVVSDLAHRLPRIDPRALDRAHGPELVNRFYEVVTAQKSAATLLLDGISVALQAAIGMIVLAFYHPFLLAFDMVLVVAVAAVVLILGRPATRTAIAESRAKHAVAAWLETIAGGPIAFKRAGGPEYALQRADALARTYLDARGRHFRHLFRQIASALALQAIASAALLGLGGWLVIDRQLTLGQLVAAELIVSSVVAAFAKLGKHLESYYDLVAALDKLGILADLPLEEDLGEATPPEPGPAALSLRGVTLAYDEGPPILAGVDLSIAAGEAVAITGASASGKSSLAALVYGLRRPSAGSIAVAGVDLRDQALRSLRRDVALVGPIELFAGTIADNVRMDRRDIPLREVRRVVEAVGLGDRIAGLEGGLQATIEVDGRPLSRSEALRLCLARALVGRPRLLVIDEALDAVDPAACESILDLLLADDAPSTVLAFTRARRVLDRCDRALTLEGGALRPVAP